MSLLPLSQTLRAAALVAACALFPAAAAFAADALPPDSIPSSGPPPYRPAAHARADEASLRAWCGALEAWAHSRYGTRAGGDALLSVAWVRAGELHETEASRAFAAAARAYPPHAAYAGIAWVRAARCLLAEEKAPDAEEALDRGVRIARRPLAADTTPLELGRWRQLDAAVRRADVLLRAQIEETLGLGAQAAERLAELADDPARAAALGRDPGDLWAQVARLRTRHGARREDVYEALRQGLGAAKTEASRARLEIWALYHRHGLLGDDGEIRIGAPWPGADFVRDALAMLEGLRGNRHAGDFLLTLGSTAYAAGALEDAVAFYVLALNDRDLMERARDDASLGAGLLVGYAAALDADRVEEAEHILEVVAAATAVPRAQIDEHRAALAERRALEAASPEIRTEGEASGDEARPRTRHAAGAEEAPVRGLLGGSAPRAREPDGPQPKRPGGALPPEALPLGPLALALGLLALLLWLARRR